MKYTVVINKTEYGFDAHCPALPGCHSQGDTFDEAMENIRDAISTYLRMCRGQSERLSEAKSIRVIFPMLCAAY